MGVKVAALQAAIPGQGSGCPFCVSFRVSWTGNQAAGGPLFERWGRGSGPGPVSIGRPRPEREVNFRHPSIYGPILA